MKITIQDSVLLIIAALSFCITSNCKADTLVEPAVYGTYRNQTPSGFQLGFSNFVSVLNYPSLGSFGVEDRAVIEFDVSNITTPVSSAQLLLTLNRNEGDLSLPLVYDVYGFAGDGVTPQLDPSDVFAGTLQNSFTVTNQPAGTVIEIDVTNFVNSTIDNNEQYAAFNLRFPGAEPPLERFTWLSSFNNDTSDAPALQLTAVPEPGTTAGAIIAVVALCTRRRR